MLSTNTIKSNAGSRKTSKRRGRGAGSGKGTFSGRGCKGQNARAGGGVPDWFEGGQTPLFRRMPKLRGFSNAVFTKKYNEVNLSDLQKFADAGVTEITLEALLAKKLIKRKNLGIKILGNGELKTKVTVTALKASESAKQAIEKAGGQLHITE